MEGTVPTILVADDDVEVRRTIVKFLTSAGYDVRQVGSGAEALREVQKADIDLMITDMYMPDTDGIELIIKGSQEAAMPRVIAITGGGHLDAPTLLEVATRLGAVRTLEKP